MLRFGGRDETSRTSAAAPLLAVFGVTANVTMRPPISLRGSFSSGEAATLPESRYPFWYGLAKFCSGEAGESILRSGTGFDDPLASAPGACTARIAIGSADLNKIFSGHYSSSNSSFGSMSELIPY